MPKENIITWLHYLEYMRQKEVVDESHTTMKELRKFFDYDGRGSYLKIKRLYNDGWIKIIEHNKFKLSKRAKDYLVKNRLNTFLEDKDSNLALKFIKIRAERMGKELFEGGGLRIE